MTTTAADERLKPRLRAAVELFNRREFFACHDVLEELWSETLGEQRQFYQGLIHAAVCLFHFSEGNLGGARKMYGSAVRYLDSYRPWNCGIEVEELLAKLQHCFAPLLAARDGYPSGVVLDEERIPSIHFNVGQVSNLSLNEAGRVSNPSRLVQDRLSDPSPVSEVSPA